MPDVISVFHRPELKQLQKWQNLVVQISVEMYLFPYPFGIGSSCYFDEWYEITCNASHPVLTKVGFQVIKISLKSLQVTVNAPMVLTVLNVMQHGRVLTWVKPI
ncbi:putative wall-associated receptor kinase-like 11 [Bienertia sinuspersici]